MTNKKHEDEMLKQEGKITERARVQEIIGRHVREFRSRGVEVDQRVAGAIEEIGKEIAAGAT